MTIRKSKPKIVSLYEMELAIAKMFNYRKYIIIPNISWGLLNHEVDLFVLSNSGFAYEIEIKRSISDLKKDFEKSHHHKDSRIREFYYALPEELYEKCLPLIPEEAGIITVVKYDNMYNARFRRNSKINTKSRKLTPEEILKATRLGCMRIWNLKSQVIGLKNDTNYLRKEN